MPLNAPPWCATGSRFEDTSFWSCYTTCINMSCSPAAPRHQRLVASIADWSISAAVQPVQWLHHVQSILALRNANVACSVFIENSQKVRSMGSSNGCTSSSSTLCHNHLCMIWISSLMYSIIVCYKYIVHNNIRMRHICTCYLHLSASMPATPASADDNVWDSQGLRILLLNVIVSCLLPPLLP